MVESVPEPPQPQTTEETMTETQKEPKQAVVTPWEVSGRVDYNKLIEQFGCRPISHEILQRFENVTGETPHVFLRRGIFFSHRDLNDILDRYEAGQKFYLYTGRGPSSTSMHLGHLVPFIFTAYLQKVFKCPTVIQLTDDEKFLFAKQPKGDGPPPPLEYFTELGRENARDIIAVGFELERTFLFTSTGYIGPLYPNVLRIQRMTTYNQAKAIFGFADSDNIGKHGFPAVQAAPALSTSFPVVLKGIPDMACLIPCAIDQDPYFRLTRDVAPRMGSPKPALIHSKFFPALQGDNTKMSSSIAESAIFLNDTAKKVKTKVNKYAFSGGRTTIEEHRRLGADVDIDIPYRYLSFFLEDDVALKTIYEEYKSGRMLSGEIKKELIDVLQPIVKNHQEKRAAVTDEVLDAYFEERPLKF